MEQIPRYLSIEAILADEERVPVVWLQDAARVGYLDASVATEDVEKGTRMELPLWLAEELYSQNMVRIEVPSAFGLRSRAELRASARTVRLRDKSPAFYEVGLKLAHVAASEETATLSIDVQHALADRIGDILDKAEAGLGDMSAFKESLTDTELRLYTAALLAQSDRLLARGGRVRSAKALLPHAASAQAIAAATAAKGAAAGGLAVVPTSTGEIIAAATLPQKTEARQLAKRGRTAADMA